MAILDGFDQAREAKSLGTYQIWYTRALAVVRELLPDRNDEFVELYQPQRKSIKTDLSGVSYGIADYLRDVRATEMRYGHPTDEEAFNHAEAALSKLHQQVRILESAKSRFDDILANIRGVLQAELFDTELDAARELHRAGHFRASGAVAGVVLERHLGDVASSHNISAPKKDPHISDWNEALKKAGVVDVPIWRGIHRLSDLRNICVHNKDREPRSDEASELIEGVDKLTKTLA